MFQIPGVVVETPFNVDKSGLVDILVPLLAFPDSLHPSSDRIHRHFERILGHVIVDHVIHRAFDEITQIGQSIRAL